jgi:hypothetical protein
MAAASTTRAMMRLFDLRASIKQLTLPILASRLRDPAEAK